MVRFIFVFILVQSCCSSVEAAAKIREANEAKSFYDQEEYRQAVEKYQEVLKTDPESDVINFGLGTALYKQGEFAKALTHLQKSLLSEDDALRAKAHYNTGNAYYKAGIAQENQSVDRAIASLEQALQQYKSTLNLNDKDADAQYNYEFVKQELERLKQKKQQQQQQSQQQNQDSPENQEDQGKEDSQSGQDQNQEDGGSEDQSESAESPESSQSSGEDQPGSGEEDEEAQEDQSASGDTAGEDASDDEEKSDRDRTDSSQTANTMIPPGEMSEGEAQMLLKSYQQGEEPQGLLNFMKDQGSDVPVVKDW